MRPMRDPAIRSSLIAVLATTLGVGLIFGFQPPLIAMILARDGVSSTMIGSVTSASALAVIALGPAYPRIIAWLGLRRAILIGIGLAIIVLLALTLFSGIPIWIGLRLAGGSALGLSWIASEIWLNSLATDRSRGTVMAAYATVFAAGVVAGPLLLEFTGTVGLTPFVVGAGTLALTAVPLAFVRHVPEASRDTTSTPGFVTLAAAAPSVMLAALIAGMVESADLSLLPVFGLRSHLGERAALLLVTVFLAGNVVLQLPIGQLADRFGRRATLGACAIVGTVGPLLLPGVMQTPWLMWSLLFIWGGTMYGFYTQGLALLGESYPASQLAAANTVFVVVYCAGGVLGPSLGGLSMDLWRPAGLMVFVSAAALLLIVGLLVESRRLQMRLRRRA